MRRCERMTLRVTIRDSEKAAIRHRTGRIVRGEEADTLCNAVMCRHYKEVVTLNLAS